jgi:DNA-directed RNA polymerase specialized sigma24 family protein
MSTTGSVSRWIRGLEAGDAVALQRIWERYFERLIRRARRQLPRTKRLRADEEDVVLGAFNSFFLAARSGRFPKLKDRNDLWQILVMLTHRKAVNLIKEENADKRPGKLVRWTLDDFSEFVQQDPTPAFAAEVAEEYRKLLGQLQNPVLENIAILKMEGYTNKEIAVRLGRSVATVELKLRLIRKIWHETAVTSII